MVGTHSLLSTSPLPPSVFFLNPGRERKETKGQERKQDSFILSPRRYPIPQLSFGVVVGVGVVVLEYDMNMNISHTHDTHIIKPRAEQSSPAQPSHEPSAEYLSSRWMDGWMDR